MKLYGYWRSSASWRVRWAFNLKGLVYTYVPVNILAGENKAPAHLARNPLGALPVLEIKPGLFLSESLAMLEWIEETHPKQGVSLYPGSAENKAIIRSLCEIINSETGPLQTPRAQNRHSSVAEEKSAWAAHFIRQGLDAYTKIAAPWMGLFSVGNTVSAADLCLIPQIYNAKRYGIAMEQEFPALDAIYKRCLALPECLNASPEKQIDAA